MNKEEFKAKFEKSVEYLQKTIPPDDIYLFTEQTFMAAMYFLLRWSQTVDIKKEAEENEICRKWITNVLAFDHCKEYDIDITLNLDMDSIDEFY